MAGRIKVVIFALVVLAGYQPVSSQSATSFNGYDLVDKTGNIRKPTDVRDLYQFLGTYTPNGSNGDTEMHVTYASPVRLSITEKTASSPMEPYSLKKRSRPITPNDDRRRTLSYE